MAAAHEGALRAEGLSKSFQRRQVVQDVSFHVAPGEVVGLLGPNGAGKTTSFRMVAGLVEPDQGRVHLGANEMTSLPLHARARAGLGYLPQESSVFRKLTVRENFLVALEGLSGLSRTEREARAAALLTEFRIEKLRDTAGERLSGGERRRVEIARSLIPGPKFILFDEPFAGVDPIAVGDLQRQIGELRHRGIGVLITDHSVRETLGICDRAYILAGGRILEEGTPAELAKSERARAAYLGEGFHLG
jgi:lipopolysaccharide export system ATP-binding protein